MLCGSPCLQIKFYINSPIPMLAEALLVKEARNLGSPQAQAGITVSPILLGTEELSLAQI